MYRFLMVAALAFLPAGGQDEGPQNYVERFIPKDSAVVREFLSSLQHAVAMNDRAAIASLVEFPVQYVSADFHGTTLDEKTFARRYDEIFNQHLRRALAQQKPEDLFANISANLGVASGCGEIWFWDVGMNGYKITSLNLSKYAAAGITSMKECAEFDRTFRGFQQAVARGDRMKVASVIQFPITVNVGKRALTLKNKVAFLREYDTVMSAPLKNVLVSQRVSELSVGPEGIGVGDGEFYFSQVVAGRKSRMTVVAINDQPVP